MLKSISSGSVELVRWRLNCSLRSLLTPMSWNIRCSLHVYSTTTRMLQLACLGIVRDVQMLNQTLSKHSAVKFMENVFIGDIFKGHHHLVEWIFQISLFWIFSALLQHKIAVLGQKFWGLGRGVGCFRHGIAIYKFATRLVECSNKSNIIVKSRHHQGVVFTMYI